MKIAVGTDDGIIITQHLGKAEQYIVFTIENKKVVSKETRIKRTFIPPVPGSGQACDKSGCPHPGHDSMAGVIFDCQVLIT